MTDETKIEQEHKANEEKLRSVLQHIEEKLIDNCPDCLIETDIKTLKSILRKAKNKKTTNIMEFSDLIRGRLCFPDKYNYHEMLQKLIDIFGNDIKKLDWKQTKDHGLEYHGIVHLDLCIDGINFELQIVPLGFKKYMEPQHKIYELLRDHNAMPKETKEHLKELHNKIFEMLEKKYLD